MLEPDHKNLGPEDFERFLLSQLKLRDEAAFDYIYKRWEKPLFRFIANIVGSQSAAEDICQEAFAKLWLTCDSIDPDKNIKTYIFLISKQLTLNFIRDQKRKNANALPLTPVIDDSDDHALPDKILEDRELQLLTEYAISKLPPQMRKVFDLFYFENMSYAQIAAVLNMTPNGVAVQIHKARARLEKEILSSVMALYMFLQ